MCHHWTWYPSWPERLLSSQLKISFGTLGARDVTNLSQCIFGILISKDISFPMLDLVSYVSSWLKATMPAVAKLWLFLLWVYRWPVVLGFFANDFLEYYELQFGSLHPLEKSLFEPIPVLRTASFILDFDMLSRKSDFGERTQDIEEIPIGHACFLSNHSLSCCWER